jgi:hypothetical protein
MTPRDERVLVREQRKLSPYVQPNFDFLGLPRELRNNVYNRVWQWYDRVATYHVPTKTGILAYYNGMILSESELSTYSSLRRYTGEQRWHSNHRSGLPRWLLSNKQIMAEGMAQFRLEAHWNLLPAGYHSDVSKLGSVPDSMLMSPIYAVSMSLSRIISIVDTNLDLPGNRIRVHLERQNIRWLDMLVKHLGDTPTVRTPRIVQGFPYIAFARNAKEDGPSDVNVRFPYTSLIKACKRLLTLEVELFDFDQKDVVDTLDTEFLEHYRSQFLAPIPGDVVENTTTTPTLMYGGYLGGRQLLEWLLVYTKRKTKMQSNASQ